MWTELKNAVFLTNLTDSFNLTLCFFGNGKPNCTWQKTSNIKIYENGYYQSSKNWKIMCYVSFSIPKMYRKIKMQINAITVLS